ncbi:MAG: DUF1003 domain-containing protein [Pseudomonadota bacterium]
MSKHISSEHKKYLKKLLEVRNKHQKAMNRIVVESITEEEGLVNNLYQDEKTIKSTLAEKISDTIASFGGSWIFILIFFTFIFSWMIYNTAIEKEGFDPYPYILLNLILSCIAAVQAPIILMSQNRKANKENKRAQDEYLINLKAELENRMMNQKLDILINHQLNELVETHKFQMKKIDQLAILVKAELSEKKKTTSKKTKNPSANDKSSLRLEI